MDILDIPGIYARSEGGHGWPEPPSRPALARQRAHSASSALRNQRPKALSYVREHARQPFVVQWYHAVPGPRDLRALPRTSS